MWSQEKYQFALDFAARVHGAQQVPGKGYSYVVHLSEVCMEVLAALVYSGTGDADLAMQCALLHDTIEDTALDFSSLVKQFGKPVALGVLALTKDNTIPKSGRMKESLERILQEPPEIGMVKMADRITNLQPPPPHWTLEKISAYREEAEEILAALAHCNAYLAERLKQKIHEYGQYCSLQDKG